MRRIAIVAATIAAIAGTTAAFAADTAPSTPAPARDPLLGTWALMIDGAYAGPVASVDGCSLTAEVVQERPGPDNVAKKNSGNPGPAPCSIEVGLGMSQAFHMLLKRSMANPESPRNMQLVRVDGKPYGLDLLNAVITALSLPKLDAADKNPAFMTISLAPEALRYAPAPSVPKQAIVTPARGFVPATLSAQLDGARVDATSIGPWKVELPKRGDSIGSVRDGMGQPTPGEIGNVALRVPEPRIATLDGFMRSFLIDGKTADTDERTLVVSLGDVKSAVDLTFEHTGLVKGDLAPRADGARSYELYAERVTVAAR